LAADAGGSERLRLHDNHWREDILYDDQTLLVDDGELGTDPAAIDTAAADVAARGNP